MCVTMYGCTRVHTRPCSANGTASTQGRRPQRKLYGDGSNQWRDKCPFLNSLKPEVYQKR